jgi:hypothetical protein
VKNSPKVFLFLIVVFFMSESFQTHAQVKWAVGGRFGLSIGSGGGGSSAGVQLGPTGEVMFNRNMAVQSELNINTQAGTPIEWANSFKYYFEVPGSNIKPYADAGFGLWFFSGGPYFGIRFGGGALFKIAPNLYIPADLQLGPVFYSTSTYNYFYGTSSSSSETFFYFAITSGIRYEIPTY